MVIRKYFDILDESKRHHKKRSFYKDRLSILEEYHTQITEQRRKRVIDLYFNQHKTYAEIAQIERMFRVTYILS